MTTKTFGAMIPPQIAALSYSRIKTYQSCPLKAKLKFLDKLKEPDSPHAARGTKLHEYCEQFLKTGEQVPGALSKVGLLLHNLREELEVCETELKISFDKEWKEVDWFSPATSMRVIWDVLGVRKKEDTQGVKVGVVVDHKSGKVYDDHAEQLELYGLTALLRDEELALVEASAIYIDQGFRSTPITITRAQIPELVEKWEGVMATIRADSVFEATTNRYCKWCHFRRSNGGPCQHA